MVDNKTFILLEDAIANVTGEWFFWSGTAEGTIHLIGTWDTATVTIEGSLNKEKGGTAPSNSAFTADTIKPFNMGRGWFRAVLSSVGASTVLSVYVAEPERT